jgi:hypothetical protein
MMVTAVDEFCAAGGLTDTISVLVRSFTALTPAVEIDGANDEETVTFGAADAVFVAAWWEVGTRWTTEAGLATVADSAGLPAVLGSAAAATTTPTNNPGTATAVTTNLPNNRRTRITLLN